MVTYAIKIDDKEISVSEGTTILQAAEQAEIYIPHICSHPDIPPIDQLKATDATYRAGDCNNTENLQYLAKNPPFYLTSVSE